MSIQCHDQSFDSQVQRLKKYFCLIKYKKKDNRNYNINYIDVPVYEIKKINIKTDKKKI